MKCFWGCFRHWVTLLSWSRGVTILFWLDLAIIKIFCLLWETQDRKGDFPKVGQSWKKGDSVIEKGMCVKCLGQTESAMSYEMEWKQGVEHIYETLGVRGWRRDCKVILCRVRKEEDSIHLKCFYVLKLSIYCHTESIICVNYTDSLTSVIHGLIRVLKHLGKNDLFYMTHNFLRWFSFSICYLLRYCPLSGI